MFYVGELCHEVSGGFFSTLGPSSLDGLFIEISVGLILLRAVSAWHCNFFYVYY